MSSSKFIAVSVIIIAILTGFLFFFEGIDFGLSKVTRTENIDAKATVISVDYESGYESTSYITDGEFFMPTTTSSPGKYIVTFYWNDVYFDCDNEQYYRICEDKIGEKVNCQLQILYFENGKKKIFIKDLYNE